jgi:hypothetical protein
MSNGRIEGFLNASPESFDAAKRLSDTVNNLGTHKTHEELVNGWIAVRLSDGTWDGVLYDSRHSAVSHQSNEFLCAYLSTRSAQSGMTPRDAHTFLAFHRSAYDAGFRLPDPDHKNGGKELIVPATRQDMRSQVRRLIIAGGRQSSYYKTRRR